MEELIDSLASKDSDARERAKEALLELGDKAVASLIYALNDNISAIRMKVAEMLGELKAQSAVKPLINALKDKEAPERHSAAEALGKIGNQDATAPLMKALSDPNIQVCKSAAEALEAMNVEVIEPLLEALSDESPSVRDFAVETLGKLNKDEAVSPLIELLSREEDNRVRQQALESLGKLSAQDAFDTLLVSLLDEDESICASAAKVLKQIDLSKTLNTLSEGLKSEDSAQNEVERRLQSVKALGALGGDGFELLLAALKDADVDVRCEAILALGKIESERVLDELIPLLSDKDDKVHRSVMAAINNFDIPNVLEYLEEKLDEEYEEVETRRCAVVALEQLGEPAIDLLARVIQDEDKQVRLNAIDALGRIKSATAVEPLISAMRDRNEWVRWHCAEALGKIGDKRAVPRLITALQDDRSWWVRYYATEALGKIGDDLAKPPLIKTMQNEDEEERVKQMAKKALEGLADSIIG